MVILIISIILFIAADFLIRYLLNRARRKKERMEREAALDSSLRLDFSYEAKSLKRVEVEKPVAKILCVDDEPVILDSFRKILVLEGYSVDTVESGKEALGLIQKQHYDFVYTDLKMPEMDGLEVTKAVKHMRPDIDVIIITGYGTIESAVETMQYGAMDYVQKPFSEDELLAFTKKSLIKREDRIAKELKPKVHISSLAEYPKSDIEEFAIPGGVFISEGHCWVSINQDGTAKIGLDDFAKKVIGRIDAIDLPNLGRQISLGQPLFSVRQNNRSIPFVSPLSGKVVRINTDLNSKLAAMDLSPYEKQWICMIDADNLAEEVKDLKIGKSAVTFYQDEIEDCVTFLKPMIEEHKSKSDRSKPNGHFYGKLEILDDKSLQKIITKFFDRV
jgi:CheY-like chemotaxis protein